MVREDVEMGPMTSNSEDPTNSVEASQGQNPPTSFSRQSQTSPSRNHTLQNAPPLSQTQVSTIVLENHVPFERSVQLDGTEDESELSEVPQYFLKLEPPQPVATFLFKTLSQAKADKFKLLLELATKIDARMYHSLHAQYSIFGREIVVTENPELHLVVSDDNQIFIQPLPPCLTNYTFFKQYVIGNLKPLALGFLYSYTRLIQHKSDYRIAREKGLLDEDVTWQMWQKFRFSLEADTKSHHWEMHRRYRYGELRLADLNFAFLPSYCKRPSRVGWTTKLIKFYTLLATFFSFYTVGLVGFQVATGPTAPNANAALTETAYWYAIAGLCITAFFFLLSYYLIMGPTLLFILSSYLRFVLYSGRIIWYGPSVLREMIGDYRRPADRDEVGMGNYSAK